MFEALKQACEGRTPGVWWHAQTEVDAAFVAACTHPTDGVAALLRRVEALEGLKPLVEAVRASRMKLVAYQDGYPGDAAVDLAKWLMGGAPLVDAVGYAEPALASALLALFAAEEAGKEKP